MPTTENYRMLLTAAAACEDKKAEDIRILALDPSESGLTDYFLICNGTNPRQNTAITDEIELRLKREFGAYPNSVEGRRQGDWILMDYVDFIVHVFSREKRAFYGLERLRKSATTISVSELNAELKAAIAASRERQPSQTPPAKFPVKKAAKKVAEKPAKKLTKAAARTTAKAEPRKAAKAESKTVAKKASVKAVTAGKPAAKKSAAKKPTPKPAASKKPATKKKPAAKK